MTKDDALKLADEINKKTDLYEAFYGESSPDPNSWAVVVYALLYKKEDVDRILSIVGNRGYYIDIDNDRNIRIHFDE